MTSDEFRHLLNTLSTAERQHIAEIFNVTQRTVQRWGSYGTERRDALRNNPEISRLSYEETLLGLRGTTADLIRPANKGSGEVNEDFTFRNFADAARFAMKVRQGRTDNTFLNNAVTRIEVVSFGGGFSVLLDYDASYSESEGWADRVWDDFDYDDSGYDE